METYREMSDAPDKIFEPITLRAVGFIRNEIDEPFLKAGDDGIEMEERIEAVKAKVREIRTMKSEIVIHHSLVDILSGIENYSHLMILYWAHKVPEQSRSLTQVHPMGRKEIPITGIFSTCSPARPNPVLASVVRLCGIKENVLTVAGIDAVDGSPVIDIKPYVKQWYPQQDIKIPEWMHQIIEDVDEEL